ncbi:MAG TPA: ribonuclease P protein component [Chitinophagaceae bacterium]
MQPRSSPGLFVILHKTGTIRQFTLHKHERLKKQRYIDQLFQGGKSFSTFPLRVYWTLNPSPAPEPGGEKESVLQFGAGASKRNFKRAVDRNRIKRLLREAYRTQKLPLLHLLQESGQGYLKLFVLYTGRELPEYQVIMEKVGAALQRIEKELGIRN